MTTEHYPSTSLVRWGPVVAGAVVGFAVMILLSTFWVALAEGAGAGAIGDNLHWYGLISAIVALFVAGFLAGWLSGVRGPGTGLLHGVTVWSLILVATLAFAVPQTLRVFEAFTTPLPELGAGPAWASFFSVLIGLVAAGAGGLIGGAITRPAAIAPRERPHYTEDADRHHPGETPRHPEDRRYAEEGRRQPEDIRRRGTT